MYQATGISTAISTAQALVDVTRDPHLPEVVCHVLRLDAMESGQPPGPPCQKMSTKAYPGKGIGLRYAVPPLRVLDWAREHPIRAAGIAVGTIGALVWIGYLIGEGR